MKGRLFGIVKETPCPECGGPRVGYDYDDDYFIEPGIFHEGKKASCGFPGYERKRGGGWELVFTFASVPSGTVREMDEEPNTCPYCGEKLQYKKEKVERYSSRGSYVTTEERWVCPNAKDQPDWVESVEGCPKCKANAYWN